MQIFSFDENGSLRSAEVPDEELSTIKLGFGGTALEMLQAGETAYIGDRWVFPAMIRTTRGIESHEGLTFWQGMDSASGAPGSCDAHYLCVRTADGKQLIKRAVHAIVRFGVEIKAAGGSGQEVRN